MSQQENADGRHIIARDISDPLQHVEGDAGFLYLSTDRPWPDDPGEQMGRIPEDWLESWKDATRVRASRRGWLPRPGRVRADGRVGEDGLAVHWLAAPFRYCPACGVRISRRLPDVPRRQTGPYDPSRYIRPGYAFRSPGDVTVDRNDERVRIEIEYGNLQPGRRVRSDVFCIGIAESGGYELIGRVFADNLPRPKDFTLTITATVSETRMTVEELTALPDPAEPGVEVVPDGED